MKLVLLFCVMSALGACTAKTDIPLEFPTPPPLAAATPLAKLDLKRDAELEQQFSKIADEAKGKVGVAAVVIETGQAALLNENHRFPMQSVYKLPIAMAVMDQVRLGKLDLEEKIGVTKEDFVRVGMRSPLRDDNPNGGEFTIRELVRLSLVESDGTASDVLMRVSGGADEIQYFLTQIGITDLRVVNSEKEIGRDWETQYQNSSTPAASLELLRWLQSAFSANSDSRTPPERAENHDSVWAILIKDMSESNPGPRRLKGLLPKGGNVAHKTGTSGTKYGVTAATNDVGIITLDNGNHLAIAVFVSDSSADERTREGVIAKVAKAVWDRWNR